MATAEHEITYDDGRKRVKLLSKEDADRLREEDRGVKSVKRLRGTSDKSRRGGDDNEVDNPHADEEQARRIQDKRAKAADEAKEQ